MKKSAAPAGIASVMSMGLQHGLFWRNDFAFCEKDCRRKIEALSQFNDVVDGERALLM
jgi:hypothetical protein